MAIEKPDRQAMGEFTRRSLFGLGVAGAAAGVTAVVAPSSGAETQRPWLIGSVERVESDSVFYVKRVRDDGPAVRVELDARASVLRDGPAALADFAPGEEVGAGGEWREDGIYVADTVESTYRLLDAEVRAADAETLVTDDGVVILFTGSTEPRGGVGPQGQEVEATPVDDIDPGDRVMVLGRRPGGVPDRLVAGLVGTYE